MTVLSHSLSALAAGALVLSAAGAAQAQTPYSAYNSQTRDIPNSCRNVQQLANGYVSAECQTSAAGAGARCGRSTAARRSPTATAC